MNNTNRLFDDISKLVSDTVLVAQNIKVELDEVIQNQAEKAVNYLNLVPREHFDIVQEMAEKARLENEKLTKKLQEIEEKFDQFIKQNNEASKKED